MRDPIPDHLTAEYRRVTEAIAELNTVLARAPVPSPAEFDPVDPAHLSEAAADNPSPELRAVARAVRDGRTSWAEVAAGGGGDLAEVQALRTAALSQLADALDVELGLSPPHRPNPPEPDDEDYSQHSVFG